LSFFPQSKLFYLYESFCPSRIHIYIFFPHTKNKQSVLLRPPLPMSRR
jgi:hypothetical protein